MSSDLNIVISIGARDARQDRYPVHLRHGSTALVETWAQIDRRALLEAEFKFSAREYGLKLYDAVFAPDLNRAYQRLIGQASGAAIRVQVQIHRDAPELHALSWERLFHVFGQEPVPLAADAHTPFSRFLVSGAGDQPPVEERRLRMLVALANPEGLSADEALDEEVVAEAESLAKLLAGLPGRVQGTLLAGRTPLPEPLRDRLDEQGWTLRDGVTSWQAIQRWLPDQHVLHILAHGRFEDGEAPGTGTAYLLLEHEGSHDGPKVVPRGSVERVPDDDIVTGLANLNPPPQLVFLAACDSAKRPREGEVVTGANPFVGLAPKLVEAGVPAVAAMQEEVEIGLARTLAADFYRRLFDHGEVDRALNEARSLVYEPDGFEWAKPVLFLRLRNGKLFQRPVPWLRIIALAVAIISILALLAYFTWDAIWGIPPPMSGYFNVALAEFGELDDRAGSQAHESQPGTELSEWAFKELRERLDAIPDLAPYVVLQHERIGFIRGDSPEARQRAAAKLAREIRADIVIYGNLEMVNTSLAYLVPEFYVTQRLTGAEESTGNSAFGSDVQVNLPLDHPENRVMLQSVFVPRTKALAEFVYGLAFLKADEPDMALEQFELAGDVGAWKDIEGKEVLYLWMGSAIHARALQESPAGDFACPIEGYEISEEWECARAAYEKARDLNPSFARAYIGLGNLWASQDERIVAGQPTYACPVYELAVQEYQEALPYIDQAYADAYVDLKIYFSIGRAFATGYRHQCGEQYYAPAVENLSLAVDAYGQNPDTPLVRELGAKSFYQLGLVYMQATQYAEAVAAFTQVAAIAEPESNSEYEDEWQGFRWTAYRQLGHAYSRLATGSEDTRWQDAIDAFDRVIAAWEQRLLLDGTAVSDAYYGRGLAQEAQGKRDEARASYESVLTISEGDSTIQDLARQKLVDLGG